MKISTPRASSIETCKIRMFRARHSATRGARETEVPRPFLSPANAGFLRLLSGSARFLLLHLNLVYYLLDVGHFGGDLLSFRVPGLRIYISGQRHDA